MTGAEGMEVSVPHSEKGVLPIGGVNALQANRYALQVPTQTRAIGVIVPPPDIRSIVDKTAQFVGRNGPEFEKRILANEKNNAKFNFLNQGDPYHAYYQQKVQEARSEAAGAKPEVQAVPISDAPGAKVAVQTAGMLKPVVLEAPSKEEYTVAVPEGLSQLQLDVIRLAAQFVARNGSDFLRGLAGREKDNPEFAFLKPQHSLFAFFRALTDAYSKVLMVPKGTLERLKRDAESPAGVLERCLKRLEWDKAQERVKQEADDRVEAEREAMGAIDWFDFVVVETIDFFPDEDDVLPPPLTMAEVLQQQRLAPAAGAEAAGAAGMDMDVTDADEVQMMQLAQEAEAPLDAPPPGPGAPGEQMKIVKNYKRPGAGAAAADAGNFVVSPITGELVPVEQMAEHMRISLIDPKWKVQRDAMLAKLRGSTVAADDEIARNVLNLARTRPDIFSSSDAAVSSAVKDEIQRSSAGGGAAAPPPMPPPPLQPLPPFRGLPPVAAPLRPLPPPPARPPPPLIPLPQVPPAPLPQPTPHAPFPLPPAAMPMPGLPPMPLPSALPAIPPPLAPAAPPPLPSTASQAAHAPPLPTDEPSAKRHKAGEEPALQPESEWLESHPGGATLQIACPQVDGEASLSGQTLSLGVSSLGETLAEVKTRLEGALGVAAAKQKLSAAGLGFLKDNLSLAHYNLADGAIITLALKTRGGKKA